MPSVQKPIVEKRTEERSKESMKRIGEIRAKLAWIHTYRNLAVADVNDRDEVRLRNHLRDMKRCIAELEKLLEE